MKIQGTSVSAAQPQVQTSQAGQPVQAQGGQAASQLNRDGFDQLKGTPMPIYPGDHLIKKPEVTLDLGDRFNAANLSSELSSRVNDIRLALSEKTETVSRDRDGTFRGPEGQPLVEVKLDDGNTAYVDPNTNEYYLTDAKPDIFGNVQTLPAAPLPEGSRFSNSHFSDADVKSLQRHADSGSVFMPVKPSPYRLQPSPMETPIPLANRGPIAG